MRATMTPAPSFDALRRAAATGGLALRGGFYPEPRDAVPAFPDGGAVLTVVLFGLVGSGQWPAFTASRECADGRPNPLDRWSRRIIDKIGTRHDAVGLSPSEGPPWLPFQQWAKRAESVHVSPLGILIHPDYGLWHSYRGALCFRTRVTLPQPVPQRSPCHSCADKPCLRTCPVGAFSPGHFDRPACRGHVASAAGTDCVTLSCRARRSCPVGAALRYGGAQSRFHMAAFLGPPC